MNDEAWDLRKKLWNALDVSNLSRIVTPGDGDCLYHALRSQYPHGRFRPSQLRAMIAVHIRLFHYEFATRYMCEGKTDTLGASDAHAAEYFEYHAGTTEYA